MWPCIIIVLTLINSVVESGLVTSYSPKELAAENVGYQVKFQKDWFNLSLLGEAKQVSGIAANFTQPTIGIFHRSTAVWDQNTFDDYKQFLQRDKGPISVDPILLVNRDDSKLITSFGSNTFYMPHGISFDHWGNIWLTDVALHQVLMYASDRWDRPALRLGTAFVPGTPFVQGQSDLLFCQPTDVKVSHSGLVFVSDGYCKSRIALFRMNGTFVKNIGNFDKLQVPHSLALSEPLDLICVADRENGRIVCYSAGILDEKLVGQRQFEVRPGLGAIYAIELLDDHLVGVAIARNAPDAPDVASAFILNLLTKVVVQKWNIQDTPFRMPHDVTVDLQRSVYISEIDAQTTNKVLRFDLKQVTSSKQRKSDLKMPLYLKLLVLSGSFLIVMTIGAIYLRFKFNKRQKHDISVAFKQLFSNPQDEGFDRLALDEELNERLMSDNSESEVEEFSSTNYSRKS